MALVPEDRKQQGLALSKSARDNCMAASLWMFSRGGFIRWKALGSSFSDVIRRLGIVMASPRQIVSQLSGGNQQKIVIGKWLTRGARLYLLDEPTRGIDVGAKAEVYSLIEQLLEAGSAVLLVTSDLSELVQLADRAYVMRDGFIVGHLEGTQLSEEAILRLVVHDE
jgi:ribose transport system ATP-binding protein